MYLIKRVEKYTHEPKHMGVKSWLFSKLLRRTRRSYNDGKFQTSLRRSLIYGKLFRNNISFLDLSARSALRLSKYELAAKKYRTADKYGLKSVEDMKKPEIAKLFADPEAPGKGRMTSCISGWTCYTINLVKHKVYGLDEYYTNFDPGSGGALDAAIAGAFKKGKPVFSYYWTPTGLMGKVDLVQLEEPAYDNACWTKMMAVVEKIKADGPDAYTDTCASAYVNMALTKSASTTFANKKSNKKIIDFVRAYSVPTPDVNRSLAFYMDESGGDMEATAKPVSYTHLTLPTKA